VEGATSEELDVLGGPQLRDRLLYLDPLNVEWVKKVNQASSPPPITVAAINNCYLSIILHTHSIIFAQGTLSSHEKEECRQRQSSGEGARGTDWDLATSS